MQEKSPLVFNYEEIKAQGGLSVKLEPSPAAYADLFDAPTALKKLSLELEFSVGGDSILLEGIARAELEMECSRCAEPLTRGFEDSFDEVYPDTVEYIDTREVIRETVALLTPIKVLCAENCKGRCLVCGTNRNKQPCSCRSGSTSPFSALQGLKLVKQDKPRKKKL